MAIVAYRKKKKPVPPMQQIALISRRADAFCARLNGGLSAVAIVLAVITAITLIVRFPPLADAENGIWAVDPPSIDGVESTF